MTQSTFNEGYIRALRWAGWANASGGLWKRRTLLQRSELDLVSRAVLTTELATFYTARVAGQITGPGLPGLKDANGTDIDVEQQAGHVLALIRARYMAWTEFPVSMFGDPAARTMTQAARGLDPCYVDYSAGSPVVVIGSMIIT